MEILTESDIKYELYKKHKMRYVINLLYAISFFAFAVNLFIRIANITAPLNTIDISIFTAIISFGLACFIMDELVRTFEMERISIIDDMKNYIIHDLQTNRVVGVYPKEKYQISTDLDSLIILPPVIDIF